MRNVREVSSPYADDKVIASRSLFGMMNVKGKKLSSKNSVRAISNMHERGDAAPQGKHKKDFRFSY